MTPAQAGAPVVFHVFLCTGPGAALVQIGPNHHRGLGLGIDIPVSHHGHAHMEAPLGLGHGQQQEPAILHISDSVGFLQFFHHGVRQVFQAIPSSEQRLRACHRVDSLGPAGHHPQAPGADFPHRLNGEIRILLLHRSGSNKANILPVQQLQIPGAVKNWRAAIPQLLLQHAGISRVCPSDGLNAHVPVLPQRKAQAGAAIQQPKNPLKLCFLQLEQPAAVLYGKLEQIPGAHSRPGQPLGQIAVLPGLQGLHPLPHAQMAA